MAEDEEWIMLTSKIIEKWRKLLEDDPQVTYSPRTMVGLYYDDVDNLIFVLNAQRTLSPLVCTNIIVPCLSQSNVSRLIH